MVAGLVAEKYFGFDGSVSQAEVDIERDHANARALGNSLLVCLLVPWALCLVSYTGNAACASVYIGMSQCSLLLLWNWPRTQTAQLLVAEEIRSTPDFF